MTETPVRRERSGVVRPLRRVAPAELAEALEAYRRWLASGGAGAGRLDLSGCDLAGAALPSVLLNRAVLSNA